MSCNLTPNSLALNGKLDRNQFIRSFIESQRTHLSSYASEGQTAQRALMTKTPTLIAENPELPSIFGSPVLKPRVPENNQRTTEVTQPAGKIKPKEAVEAGKMKISTSREKDSKRTNDLARLGEKQSTKQVTLDRFVKPEVRRSRKRRESSDSEHEARLAERRERRKKKRDIVKAPTEGRSTDEEDEGLAVKKTKKKKGGEGNLVAGLALMHGFTAANVGISRLTIKPSSGLFHKGKASAKNSTPKITNQQKRRKVTWSEDQFLNNKEETKVTRFDKEKQNLSRTQERNQTPSICSTSSGSMKSEAEPKSVQTREMRNDVKRLDQRSRDSSPESPSLTTGSEEAAKAPSITWDMEKESYVTKNASTVSRSVVLDTTHLVWSRKAQNAEFGKDTEDREAQTVTTIPCGASLISIGPSLSASQTRVDPLTPGMAQLSRYFSVPTEAPMVNSTESDASVRPTQERPPTHAPQAVTIPNEMGNTLEDATGDNAERNVLAEQYAPGFVAGLENFQEQPTRSLLLSIEDELQSHAGLEFTKDQPFNMAEATGIRIGTDYRAHSRTFSFNQSRESTELQNPNPILESAQEFSILPGYQQVEETFIPHYQLEEDVEPDIRGGAIWEDEFGEGHHEPICDGLFLMPNAEAETVVPHILDEYIENPSNPQFYIPDPTQVPQCGVEVTTGHLYDELEDEISFVRSVDGYSEESPITMQGNQDETMEGTESVMFSEGRVVGAAEFSHGRELLLGLANTNQLGSSRFQTMLKVEEDVAKSLRGHWTPQKY